VDIYEQTEHDRVVIARVKQLELFYRVLADPDITRNSSAYGLYPDIIVIDPNNRVVCVEKVATESAMNEDSKNEQWLRYSRLSYPFNLIIPYSQIKKARYLIRGLNIHKLFYYLLFSVDIGFYQVHNFDIELRKPKHLQHKNLKLT
jgi:hypothetical protein